MRRVCRGLYMNILPIRVDVKLLMCKFCREIGEPFFNAEKYENFLNIRLILPYIKGFLHIF